MVTDFDPGVALDTVWNNLDYENRLLSKEELQEKICRVDSFGRLDSHLVIFQDPYRPETKAYFTTFANEEDFDPYKVTELRKRHFTSADRLRLEIQKLSKSYSQKFVFTHGDLNARNIQVRQVVEAGRFTWRLSGILDWETSGFFPKYIEYVQAKINNSHNSPRGWRRFLVGLLEEINIFCSRDRVWVEDKAIERIIPLSSCPSL